MDVVKGIRVHNTGAFSLSFHVQLAGGATTAESRSFGVGECSEWVGQSDGSVEQQQMWPVADIDGGVSGRGARDNVMYTADQSAPMGVYNCGGTSLNPSWDYQGTSTDPDC